jgi:putative tricarboxylic transport membrane protein
MLQQVISNLATLESAVAIIVGILGGMLIGALPGLSATMGVPCSYLLLTACEFVSTHNGHRAVYSCNLRRQLFSHTYSHTGTPSSAATAMDGYQLTLHGKGLKAIGVSTVSSVIGGTFSAIMLMLIAPQLSKLSLKFGPPEYFLIALFGLQ